MSLKKIGLAVFFTLAAFAVSSGSALGAPPSGFVNQLVVSGMTHPIDYAFAPDGRIFLAQITGELFIYKNGAVLSSPALALASSTAGISIGGDRGLMSFALDPNFGSNGYIYFMYTTSANHERISRFTMVGDSINPGTETVLLENPAVWGGFLNAGMLRYNQQDGKLYATMGSNGIGSNSQDLSMLEGKLLRINLDGSIPADNPFVGVPGAKGAIYGYGLRNPWRMSVDPVNGTVLIGDVGETTWEKVLRSMKGANFGWPTFEGDCTPNCNGVTPPIYVYNHNGGGASVDGGVVYSGSAFPAPWGSHTYYYGDFVQGWINTLSLDNQGNVIATSTFDSGLGAFNLATINSGPDGCLYYETYKTGELHKYCYTGGGGGGSFSATLGASTNGTNYPPGGALSITSSALANQNASGLVLDTEIWGSSGKISQNTAALSVSANVTANSVWGTVAPTASGNYTVKVGLFSADWSHLYSWNDAAAAFSVGGSPPPTTTLAITDSASVSASTFVPGGSGTITANISANQNISNANLDAEIWGPSGKISQQVVPVSLLANQNQSSLWNFVAPMAPGTYAIKIGLFSSDWSHLYAWDNAAGSFSVASSSAEATFIVSASIPNTAYNPASSAIITTNVTATNDVSNLVVDTEIFDQGGNKVLQNTVPANLLANQQFASSWNATLPSAPGQYTAKVGVFSADWSHLYAWQNRAFVFSIGTPPGPPVPGQTYPINLLNLQNNQNVSGVMEIDAKINGLDINSYTIAWRTGAGEFFSLDTDPFTQSFKHAWIDFSTWNWNANHIYPLEFQATDLSGHAIGDITINVIH